MTREEAKLTIEYLKEMQEEYIEGEGYERHPLPEWYALETAIKAIEQTTWIPVSERLPKENEYIGNVCKYYLVQDEYGDMHVAHLSSVGWIPMESLKAIGDEIIAWRELPQAYVPDINVGKKDGRKRG